MSAEPKSSDNDGPQMITHHTANVVFVNNWGSHITNVSLCHTFDDPFPPSFAQLGGIDDGQQAGPWEIGYKTGFGSPNDYWYVFFTDETGKEWTNAMFFCNMEGADSNTHSGVVVKLSVTQDEGFVVDMPSGGCRKMLA